jgi:hypothetical protein
MVNLASAAVGAGPSANLLSTLIPLLSVVFPSIGVNGGSNN